jgi:hypothetical protein
LRKLITQHDASAELGVSIRHVKRLLKALKERGDKAVIHALGGKQSNRKMEEAIEQEAVKILSLRVYEGFGPTLAAEYLDKSTALKSARDGPEVDDGCPTVAGKKSESAGSAYLAPAAEALGRAGAVGY